MRRPTCTPTSLRRNTNQERIAAKSSAPALPVSRRAHPTLPQASLSLPA
jgi:hypothetical protein